jgi:hypothetical protein
MNDNAPITVTLDYDQWMAILLRLLEMPLSEDGERLLLSAKRELQAQFLERFKQ